jgi:hypothetical protein
MNEVERELDLNLKLYFIFCFFFWEISLVLPKSSGITGVRHEILWEFTGNLIQQFKLSSTTRLFSIPPYYTAFCASNFTLAIHRGQWTFTGLRDLDRLASRFPMYTH